MLKELASGVLVPSNVSLHGSRPPAPVVAAGRSVDLTDETDLRRARAGSTDWQSEAWAYFDEVEEVEFGAGFRGAMMSRLRPFVGIIVDPAEEPMPIGDATDELGLPSGFAESAELELSRLGTPEQQAELWGQWGTILAVSGDSHLVGVEDPLSDTGERWEVFAESAIVADPNRINGLALRRQPGGGLEPLNDDAKVLRVWRPHPRWPDLAHSNLRAALGTCEEILIYARAMRAIGKSRSSSGLLYVANEIGDMPTSDGSPTAWEYRLVESLVKPTQEDGAPSSVVPHIIRGPASFGNGQRAVPARDAVFPIDLSRKLDEHAVERLELLIRRLAHGLDVPVEVLTGVADVNHWSAWQIEDTTYKAHIEPDALIPAAVLTRDVVRAGLLETYGPTALPLIRRVVVAIDPSNLVVRPNRGQDAKDVFDRYGISWEALRRHTNFPDTDAPDPQELALRAKLAGPGLGGAGGESGGGDEGDDERPGDDDEGGDPTPDTEPAPVDEPEPIAAAAVVVPPPLALPPVVTAAATAVQTGERLGAIDARLRDRLVTAGADTLATALRVVGNRLRSRAQGDPDQSDAVRGVPAEEVGAALAGLGVSLTDVEDLAADQLVGLEDRFRSWVARAYDETASVVRRAAPDEPAAEVAEAELRATQQEDTDAGWALLMAAMLGTVRERVFTPDARPDVGEFDELVPLPHGPVRYALARAGGILTPGAAPAGAVGELGAGNTVGGISTGRAAQRALRLAGMQLTAWTWDAGRPTHPFPPHQALDGTRFAQWEDGTLANGSTWPAFSGYFPGDHTGCQCGLTPELATIEGNT